MNKERVLLSVKQWTQLDNECAVCAVASIANYYDPSINYQDIRKYVKKSVRKNGLWAPQQGKLLNKLGFQDVTIISFDLELFDFSWNKLTKKGFIKRLKKAKSYYSCSSHQDIDDLAEEYIQWLNTEDCDNRVIIDTDLPKYIRKYLNNGRPVGASYDSHTLWKKSKGSMSLNLDFRGETREHAVVIRGYDDHGVFIVDSDRQESHYKVKWSQFLTSSKTGDLLLVK